MRFMLQLWEEYILKFLLLNSKTASIPSDFQKVEDHNETQIFSGLLLWWKDIYYGYLNIKCSWKYFDWSHEVAYL
jgi:hypothetical protein